MNRIKLLPTVLVKIFFRFIYLFFCLFFKVNPKKITFASSRSNKISGNLEYIYTEFQNRDDNFVLVKSFFKIRNDFTGKIHYLFHSIKECYHIATSKYFIIDDYHYLVYLIKPRKDTEIVQLWHACGAFKKFGMSLIGKRNGPSKEYLKAVKIHSNYSKVYVSSSEVIPYYAEAFDMNESKIFPLGVPRTDFFFDNHRKEEVIEKLVQKIGLVTNKQIILYAPTFRGKSYQQNAFVSPINFKILKEQLKKDSIFLVHLHPYMSSSFHVEDDLKDFVYHIKQDFTIEELLLITNVLITDYSSIIFDYSLLNKPAAFYAHDLKEYMQDRDFYYEYESLVPGPIFSHTESLVEWLNDGQYNHEKMISFKQKFFDYTDGNTSKRIVSHLISSINDLSS
ncbi:MULTISPECIES: CDP-glycerol glycerophosphotransferase family protein [Bacillaceae]|uniref:CDP-glycerol glycerophosphotransferase family protein n=1 Tax=Niallia hominis TaxID=3133173 RepID=A0ABV1EVP3_9BACI|nr:MULTISPECIES: CDP-glycerol glycerophosphotransferase family protein [unclassified Bacillus (in: firmicutes)]